MSCFRWRRIDPDRQALLGALAEAVEHARAEQQRPLGDGVVPCSQPPPATPLLLPAETLPEGNCFQVWPGDGEEPFEEDYPWRFGMVLGAAWWTDVLGRCHWLIESARCGIGSGDSSFLDSADTPRKHPAVAGLAVSARHPLVLIYPEHAGWWRLSPAPRWLVCCACGECGTLDELAWTGERCGPCFDRQLDNEPAAQGLPLPGRSPFAFDRVGRLIAPLDARWNEFAAWAPPWSSARPAWRARVSAPDVMAGSRVMACGGEILAGVNDGMLWLLDTSSGRRLASRGDPVWLGLFHLHQLAFAGPSWELLVGLTHHHQETNRQVRVWEWDKGISLNTRYELRGPYTNLAVTPDGEGLLLAGWSDTIEWRDSSTGRLLRRLRLPGHDLVGCLAIGPAGDVTTAGRLSAGQPGTTGVPSSQRDAVESGLPPGFARTLARWPVAPRPPASFLQRMTARVLGPERDEPAVRAPGGTYPGYSAQHPEFLAISPDGRLLAAWTETGVALHDAHSLELLAEFDRGCPISGLAFAPDGSTLAVSAETLMLWPVAGLLR